MTQALIALVTVPDAATAEKIGAALVHESLAACVNVLPEVQSIYRWQGAVERARELLLVVKTTRDGFERLRARVVELHSYAVPEIIALPIEAGHGPYLQWLLSSVKPG